MLQCSQIVSVLERYATLQANFLIFWLIYMYMVDVL